ncbi:hypothetical protein GCM10027291_20460 [Telluribacter humicola]
MCYICLIAGNAFGQNREAHFYRDQLVEFDQWLSTTHISDNLKIDSVSYQQEGDTLVLLLRSGYKTIDSLSTSWNSVDNQLLERLTSLVELLHQQGSFLFDLPPGLLRIEVQGSGGQPFSEIYFTEEVKYKNLSVMSGKPIIIPAQELHLPSFKRIPLPGKPLVKAVTQTLARELKRYYSSKPSSWFYSVQVDTTRTFYNSLIYRVTCLKNEITNDNYFESIELTVDVAQQAKSTVEVRLTIRGKYSGGLLCPEQRDKFYYSMDGKYDGNVNLYASVMERRIEEWLSK